MGREDAEMSCRRAFEIDLAAFLSGAGRDEFAEFRGHYPVCPECSAEIRAWTDLHTLLQAGSAGPNGGHPEPEVLLRYEQRDPPLGSAETAEVERHLARCNTCREELVALRRFDFSTLTAESAPSERARNRLAELLSGLRGLLMHPAFAYALVLLLLYPTVTAYFDGPAVPELGGPVLSDKQVPRERRDAEAARPKPVVRQPAKAPRELKREVVRAEETVPKPDKSSAPERLAVPSPSAFDLSTAPEFPGEGLESEKGPTLEQAEPTRAIAPKDVPAAGISRFRVAPVLGEADAPEEFEGAAAPPKAARSNVPQSAPMLRTPTGETPPWILRLRVPDEVRSAPRFEVRIVHANGLREVSQRFVSAKAGDEVEITLPLDWGPIEEDRVEFRALP
jgi:hypothetical protein